METRNRTIPLWNGLEYLTTLRDSTPQQRMPMLLYNGIAQHGTNTGALGVRVRLAKGVHRVLSKGQCPHQSFLLESAGSIEGDSYIGMGQRIYSWTAASTRELSCFLSFPLQNALSSMPAINSYHAGAWTRSAQITCSISTKGRCSTCGHSFRPAWT